MAVLVRWPQYVAFTLVSLAVYGGVRLRLGYLPPALLFGALGVSPAKDLYDEYRIRRERPPLLFAGVEHAPSNLVLLGLLASGWVDPPGAVAGVPLTYWAMGLAGFDLAFDLSQDLRT